MLPQEARWLRHVMDDIGPSHLYPMLNVGSSTEYFRTVDQPFIDAYIFRPAREQGQSIVHLDTKNDVGVDIVGDLTDEAFRTRLAETNFNSVLCSNLLEHVSEDTRKDICSAMAQVLPKGGYLFVTCPRKFPYHPDPIDTRFRPTVQDLAALFPGMLMVTGEEVVGETYLHRLWGRADRGAKEIVKLFMPFYKPYWWRVNLGYFSFLGRHFTASCVVLRKE
jgi:hypothetical protein